VVAEEECPVAGRTGDTGPQQLTDLGQRERVTVPIGKHPSRHQRAQQPAQRRRVRAGRLGQLRACPRVVGEEVRDAQPGRDVDHLGQLKTLNIPLQEQLRRQLGICHGHLSSRRGP